MVTTKDPVTGIEHEIHSKEGMEEAIMNANRVKYHQTENYCPFLESPLVEDFGACGDGPAMKQAMNGTYKVLSEVDQFTKDYIEVCQQNQSIIDTPCPLTRTSYSYRKSWEKMKECTASRELHFGHFKVQSRMLG